RSRSVVHRHRRGRSRVPHALLPHRREAAGDGVLSAKLPGRAAETDPAVPAEAVDLQGGWGGDLAMTALLDCSCRLCPGDVRPGAPSAAAPAVAARGCACCAAPFWIASILSIFVAVQAPRGRRPFQIHFHLFWREDLMTSMTKVAHLRSIAILFLLAVLA